MTSITVFIGAGPYTHERPYTALRFAYTALTNDNPVKIFCYEDGIFALRQNQDPQNTYNIQEWVQKCLDDEKCEIAACGVCMKARGVLESELIPGVKVATMDLAVQWVTETDKSVSF